ncbi:MAG: GDP-mannose 4,6-dehydratase [Candidatus Aenigmarchaeota archaeon]|nr:GDP-mannose 4,6-dehydratase [Candidatus Aenigmarchaeota archaeon]
MKGKKILITGGAGFLGSNLTEMLIKDNDIVCLDNVSTGNMNNVTDFIKDKNYTFVKGSIMDAEQLKKAMDGIDIVFHYAAVVGVKKTLEEPLNVLNVNLNGTRNVLETALKTGVKKVVNLSSSEVYGEPVTVPEKEDGVLNAKLPYAVAKLATELYAKAYFTEHGLKTVSIRPFNVYGPRQISSAYGFVVGIFIEQVLAGKAITVFGDGLQTRDFTFVKDNLAATILAAEKIDDGTVTNVGTGKQTTVRELAEMILKLTASKSKISYVPERKLDIVHRCADIARMKKLLGFTPKYSLEQGLKETIDWYENLA